MAIRLTSWDNHFIHISLQNVIAAIASAASGPIPGLSRNEILGMELVVPGVSEQTAIAGVLSDMDAELAGLEQRRDKTRALKQAMMQELLTGKTRLVPPEGRPCQSNPAPNG
jgi:type I restriction enzyme S subunit